MNILCDNEVFYELLYSCIMVKYTVQYIMYTCMYSTNELVYVTANLLWHWAFDILGSQ